MSKVGSRIFSFALASAALVYLCWMLVAGTPPTHKNLIEAQSSGVLETEPEFITGVELTLGEARIGFAKRDGHWNVTGHQEKLVENWQNALAQAVQFMHTATPVRVLSPESTASVDAETYGLKPAQFSVRLTNTRGDVLTALFGHIGNDGILQYMRIEGTLQTYLMSGFVGAAWRKLLVSNPTALDNQNGD